MEKNHKALCGSKLFLIDSFESDGISVQVFVLNRTSSIKGYCKQTDMLFKDGFEMRDISL